MSELLAFAIGLTAGALIGAGVVLMLRTPTRLTPEQRFMSELRSAQAAVPPEPVSTLPEPFVGYTTMPIQTIRESLRALSLADREKVRVYEGATLKRKGILTVLDALEEERANGNS